jgi:hypothetical protein
MFNCSPPLTISAAESKESSGEPTFHSFHSHFIHFPKPDRTYHQEIAIAI